MQEFDTLMLDLVTLGETCAAFVAKSGGPLRHAAEFERRIGGAESTVAAGVARLGHRVGWISRLGADELGEFILGVMRSENVDVRHVTMVTGAQTGVFVRENRSSGNSNVFYYRSTSAFTSFSPDELDEDYLGSARILHLGGITPGLSASCFAAVQRAMEIAKAREVCITFDLNYRAKVWPPEEARGPLESLMSNADHLFAGREDLFKLTGMSDQEALLDYLGSLGVPNIVLKMGADGTVWSGPDGVEHVPSIAIERAVDRFGVGDAFAAGYIAGLLRGQTGPEAVGLGNRVAGWSLQLPGNIESLPTWDELEGMPEASDIAGR